MNLEMDANNDPVIDVDTWKGDEPVTDVGTGLPILKSFDEVTYTCAEGYSTDGGAGPESKKFTISCESTGSLERPLNPEMECQPVKCDNFALPTIQNTIVTNAKESFFEFGDSVNFKCVEGFSTNAKADGPKTFLLPCQANGKFPGDHDNCVPIECGKPKEIADTLRSTTKVIQYGEGVTYTCTDGHTLSGEVEGPHHFSGQCTATGQIIFIDDDEGGPIDQPECLPISCGTPPQIANAMMAFGDEMSEGPPPGMGEFIQKDASLEDIMAWQQKERSKFVAARRNAKKRLLGGQGPEGPSFTVKYKDPDVMVMCNDGYTLDGIPGGRVMFSMRCTSRGEFSNTNLKCEEPKFHVAGEATDAQSSRIKLKKARVQFKQGEKIVGDVYTDASGLYSALLPMGEVTMTASKNGYIDQVKQITIESSIRKGQGADVSMSKVLPPGAWRAVVTWDERSRDIDSHTYFGSGFGKHAYWPRSRRSVSAPGTGGIAVDLDRDDVSGFGPETTTFKSIGKCKKKGRCLLKFKIKNYSYRDKALGDSNVKVTLYNGNSVHSTYEIPPSVGDAKSTWYMTTIFTIDARDGATKVIHKGDYDEPAYITDSKRGRQNWWSSLDHQTWSHLPWGAILQGLYTTGGNRIYNIEEGLYYRVQNWKKMYCKKQNWWHSFDRAGWSTCDNGWFMAGFYRTGHAWDWSQGTYQIEEARCCKADAGGYGTCNEQPALQRTGGWAKCNPIGGQEAAMVGLWRSNRGDIKGIEKMKCCTFPR